jgi:hypothetical protein
MADKNPSGCAIVAVATLVLLLASSCRAQGQRQDHTCTVHAAGSFAIPEGNDRQNFDKAGWGFQAGGGFAVTRQTETDRGWRWFITSSFAYEKFKANAAALAQAKMSNPAQLSNATSAHGGFSAVTLDITPRYTFDHRGSFYLLGGFGWLRRGIGFKGVNPGTLLQSNGLTLDRLASNSGVFDAGIGSNHGLTKNGGVMLFVEARVYRGMAVNGGSTLVPISLGVRW